MTTWVTRAFRIAYDGRAFHGFQRQPDVSTVEGELFAAFAALGIDEPIAYAAAGRTDAGVSALAQTIACSCPDWLTPAALTAALPPSIQAWAMADVPAQFHARYDAQYRTYRYFLHRPDIDAAAATTVATAVTGTHDFVNLCAESVDTTRAITTTDVTIDGSWCIITITAPGFLRQQVRRIAALVDLVGTGQRSVDELECIIDGNGLPGGAAIPSAPPEPLVLLDVSYPDHIGPFVVDLGGRRGVFGAEARHLETVAQVLNTIDDGIEARTVIDE